MFAVLSRVVAVAAMLFSSVVVADTAAVTPPGYVIPDTEVRPIHSTILNRDYEVDVALPESYSREPHRRYPVLFVTDANYAFPMIRALSRRVGDHEKGLEDFILVGLSYAVGDTAEFSRRRDYTPTAKGSKDAVSDMPGRKPVHGEAEAYRRFIEEEVFPLVAANYRADMQRKIFAGHSYGSLLGTHILLTKPTMFEKYILSSPSLWYDGDVMLRRERDYAAAHKDLPADVYFFIGAYETIDPTKRNPRFNRDSDMVKELREFDRALTSRKYPSLRTQVHVLADEDHLTVMPSGTTRGLMWALPAPKK